MGAIGVNVWAWVLTVGGARSNPSRALRWFFDKGLSVFDTPGAKPFDLLKTRGIWGP